MTVKGEVCVGKLPGVVAGGEETGLLGVLGQVLAVHIGRGQQLGAVLVTSPEHASVQQTVLGCRHHKVVRAVFVVDDVF